VLAGEECPAMVEDEKISLKLKLSLKPRVYVSLSQHQGQPC
jgi:hypothetical protein